MYISKIELINIRCFVDLTIDLNYNGETSKWLTILGDNSIGKSTVLKCIAIGLCDESSAAALLREEKAELIRKSFLEGKIIITLKDRTNNNETIVTTELTKSHENSPEILKQVPHEHFNLWENVFICGYGVQIGDAGGDTFDKYKPLEAVYTLFNTGSDLQNTEAIMFKQDDDVREWLSEMLQKVLMLEKYDKIEYNTRGMYISGPWGKRRVNELSDGYKRMIQIVVDFFGWQLVAKKLNNVDDEISGIIIIDELETHLHPNLQRFVVDRLRTLLPDVQIITTTHSPIVALGTSDLDKAWIIELDLVKDEINKVKSKKVDSKKYRGFTVDQILTSTAFDMPYARGGVIGDKIIRFRELFMKDSRDSDEEEDFQKLRTLLDSVVPGHGELEEDRKRQIELKNLIEELNKKEND